MTRNNIGYFRITTGGLLIDEKNNRKTIGWDLNGPEWNSLGYEFVTSVGGEWLTRKAQT